MKKGNGGNRCEKEKLYIYDPGNDRRNSVCYRYVHVPAARMECVPAGHCNGKAVGTICLGIAGALVLGVGMCMVMVWDLLTLGILVGMVGIVLLLCLIPLVKGLQ